MKACTAAAAILILLGGCGWFGYVKPTEGDRQVNSQTMGAGGFIEATADDPAIKQAGSDVKQNSMQLEKNLRLKPESPEPYSPQASLKWRQKAEEEHKIPWWWAALGGVATLILGSTGRALLMRLFPAFFGGPVGAGLMAVVGAITRFRNKADSPSPVGAVPEPGGKEALVKELLSILNNELVTSGAQKYVSALADKIEDKLGLDLKVKLQG